MQVRVLGPVDAVDEGRHLALGGPRPRTIVAALVLDGGTVSTARLVEEVWRATPPPSAVATLQSYISRLRRTLGPDRLQTGTNAYSLTLDHDESDVARFENLVADARVARDARDLREAVARYDHALACWRGDVAEDLDPGPILRESGARLVEERLLAVEERVDARLALGHHREVVGELEALTAAHPRREFLHACHMVALYRAGRQADALEVYRQARDRLVAELGVEPGPALQQLHQRVLSHDPSLQLEPVPQPAVQPPSRPSRRGPAHGNLPAPLGSFVGRDRDRRRIANRLAGTDRLVTLVGAGGCGKTQLALRVATDLRPRHPDGVWWVELASAQAAELVEAAITEALRIPESHDATPRDRIVDRLATGSQLLVLDNCEHLVDRCAEVVTELLRQCPDLRILATSRESLDVDGEIAWRVPSLELPRPDAEPEEILTCEAVRLLEVRGQAVRHDLRFEAGDAPLLARICRELDGIPLALELAAARLQVLSLAELADRLEDRLRVLRSGRRSAPARHQTLEAAIAWSYERLAPAEQTLLSRLSVFDGGFVVEDVEQVCGGRGIDPADVLGMLAALEHKSLLHRQASPAGPARHDLLATIRAFAQTRLDPDEHDWVATRHAERYADLSETAAPLLTGPQQVQWLNRLHAEQGNLRRVLAHGGAPAERIAAAVWRFWLQFGHGREGHQWLTNVLSHDCSAPPARRLALHEGAARLAAATGDHDGARDHIDHAATLAQQLDDILATARLVSFQAQLEAEAGRQDHAASLLARARSVLHDASDAWTVASVEFRAGMVAWQGNRLEQAGSALDAAERGYLEVGDRWTACLARLGAARVARQAGDTARAATLHRTNLRHGIELTVSSFDFVGMPQDLQGLALLASRPGSHELAATLLGAASALRTAVELPETPTVEGDRDEALDRAAAALGVVDATTAYERGRRLSAEAAVHLALSSTADLEQVRQPAG